MNNVRYKIDVTGTVQGIGFRPFVYKEALSRSLAGHVFNHSQGVTIEAEGSVETLGPFLEAIKNNHPPFAQIHSLEFKEIPLKNGTEFKIIESRSTGSPNTLISPDIATCPDCMNDISNPANRRYRYPFTNCTNCGPRYTIIEELPYDRPYTAMKNFVMCPDCEAEYKNPLDRRYHAQPNCCPACGPQLTLLNSHGYEVENNRHDNYKKHDIIELTKKLLKDGKIVAIKGLGGFHLTVDATNNEAVEKLRKRKGRDEKPFALMMTDVKTVREYCQLSEDEERILTSPQRPIVLLRKRTTSNEQLATSNKLANAIAPNNSYLGIMLPYTPLHHLLFTNTPTHQHTNILVMTSANLSDEPLCYKNEEAMERLQKIADYFLIHDRDIFIRLDDSITRVMAGRPMMLRRARSYTPQPILMKTKDLRPKTEDRDILAVGAELKNSVCLLKGNNVFLGQHIGDLENAASYESFEKSIGHLTSMFDVKPTIIAHDMHPDYFSTRWAMDIVNRSGPAGVNCLGGAEGGPRTATAARRSTVAAKPKQLTLARPIRLIPVQHHHAHIASCMAENEVMGPVIGIALDGTGLGTDGNIWGGEFLVADYGGFERIGQFEYIPLPGGDAAAKSPWQMAVSYLSILIPELKRAEDIQEIVPSLREIPNDKINLVLQVIEKSINTPLTSSCGRLFDAISAIIGLRLTNSFEGQAAMELEQSANTHCHCESAEGKRSNPVNSTGLLRRSALRDDSDRLWARDDMSYKYTITANNSYFTISYAPTLKGIVDDIRAQKGPSTVANKFHNTVTAALTEVAKNISQNTSINKVALSGGCFQNVLLTEKVKKLLESGGFRVYTHSLVPPNDGGIALGQAIIAQNQRQPRGLPPVS